MSGKKDIEIERKYLILRPSKEELIGLHGCDRTDIVQTYLTTAENGALRRIRKRGTKRNGYTYYYTEKTDIAFGERIERERVIGEEEYLRLLCEADPDRRPIDKTRCVFEHEGQLFELDIYPFSERYATLEIELEDINTVVKLPEYLTVIKDVTGDKRYDNCSLAASGKFPDDE